MPILKLAAFSQNGQSRNLSDVAFYNAVQSKEV
jgi:hypothetical protein